MLSNVRYRGQASYLFQLGSRGLLDYALYEIHDSARAIGTHEQINFKNVGFVGSNMRYFHVDGLY